MKTRRMEDNASMGALVRRFRKTKGMSQMDLAARIGVSYQQIQKYEKGVSGLTIWRLRQLADALDIPINEFIHENSGRPSITGLSDEEFKLVGLFRNVKNQKHKAFVMNFVNDILKL